MSRATGLAGRGLRGVDGAAVAQRHHQRREAVLPAVELLGMYVCSPPPPHRYLSWMPLANPWGIQVGDTDVGTRPPMQVGVYGKGTGGCFWGPFAFLNSSGSTPDSTGNTTV